MLQRICSVVDLKTGNQSRAFKTNKATVTNPTWDSGFEFPVNGIENQALQISLVNSNFSGR